MYLSKIIYMVIIQMIYDYWMDVITLIRFTYYERCLVSRNMSHVLI